tara:strand:- start:563 stop:1924 length:1362 start_codon:yes stop_codon:yes gene_type:complete
MGTFYSGQAGNDVNNVDINDTRRKFNFGERVAELAPMQSPFFVYLSKVAKKATNDPVFKFLEQRHQWQRRNFTVNTALTWTFEAGPTIANADSDNLVIECGYDNFGKILSNSACHFLVPGAVIAMKADNGSVYRFRITSGATIAHSGTDGSNGITTVTVTGGGDEIIPLDTPTSGTLTFSAGNQGTVVGSAWAEGTDSPVGWEDKLYDREGYTQIFKTGMNIFSGTAMATEYRGISNEYQRVWTDKLMEHKMDIEQAMLFGYGGSSNEQSSSAPLRTSWGIVPYTSTYGKVYNMSYASSGYDAFLDAMEDFFAPEGGNSGEKLVLASRKVITYLNKLGSGSFMNNSVGASQYRLDVNTVPGAFGHTVTVVNTIFGNLHFVAEPLLRGPWEDYCVCVDLSNVAYRPLVGNGVSRDTFIETNVQDNGVDGRQDQIITEAGLEISLPETHAILKFS